MKNDFQFLHKKSMGVALMALLALFTACDKGVDADEVFVSNVTNSTLQSPKAEDVTMTLSPDGAKLVVTWPVVHGAGGYEFTLYNVDDAEKPIVVGTEKEVIDGCSATRAVESDTQYKIVIRTLGNEKYNNEDSKAASELAYSTLAPSDATIEGGDINAWLAANPIPADKIGQEYTINLVGGKEYTVNDVIDFANQQVTIRGNKVNHAKITMTGKASFLTNNGFKLKFVDIVCNEEYTGTTLLGTSATPDEGSKVATGEYVVSNPIMLQGCNVTGLKSYLFYDMNKVKYCIDYLGFSDCNIQMQQKDVLVRAAKSSIIRMDIVKSTLWSTQQAGKFFMQISGQAPDKITGRTGAEFNFLNTTFYNIAYNKDFVNWNSYRGKPSVFLNFQSTLFVDCGNNDITNKMQGNANMKHDYKNNGYWYNGAEGKDKYDTSATFSDPQMVDPKNGDFTLRSAEHIAKRIGDPRWLPEEVVE